MQKDLTQFTTIQMNSNILYVSNQQNQRFCKKINPLLEMQSKDISFDKIEQLNIELLSGIDCCF